MARKPRRVFVGTRRQKINKFWTAITMLQRMDGKEQIDAERQNRAPDLFFNNQTIMNAMQRLMDQAGALLNIRR